jgi:hypothetical protein
MELGLVIAGKAAAFGSRGLATDIYSCCAKARASQPPHLGAAGRAVPRAGQLDRLQATIAGTLPNLVTANATRCACSTSTT